MARGKRVQALRGGWQAILLLRLARQIEKLLPESWEFSHTSGPCGLGAHVWIVFRCRNGRKREICISPRVVQASRAPGYQGAYKARPAIFELYRVNYDKRVHKYPDNSIGQINGLGFERERIPARGGAAWCAERLTKWST